MLNILYQYLFATPAIIPLYMFNTFTHFSKSVHFDIYKRIEQIYQFHNLYIQVNYFISIIKNCISVYSKTTTLSINIVFHSVFYNFINKYCISQSILQLYPSILYFYSQNRTEHIFIFYIFIIKYCISVYFYATLSLNIVFAVSSTTLSINILSIKSVFPN